MDLPRNGMTLVGSGSMGGRTPGDLLAMTLTPSAAKTRAESVVANVADWATSKRTGPKAKAPRSQSVDPANRRHEPAPKLSVSNVAAARCRDVPRLTVQIAETSLRSPGQPNNMWADQRRPARNGANRKYRKATRGRTVPQALAGQSIPDLKTFVRTDMISNPWGIDLQPNTSEPKKVGGKGGNTESPSNTIPCVVCPEGTVSQENGGASRQGQRKLREWRKSREPR